MKILDKKYRRRRSFPAMMLMMMVVMSTSCMHHVQCSPPEDPIQCTDNLTNTNCTITNSYGTFPDRSTCHTSRAVYPKTEAELISAVANFTMSGTKMKAATRYSHSIPKLVCPGNGTIMTGGGGGVVISTKYLNRTLDVNASALTMTVESGMTLRELISEAAKANMALPYAPYWWGVTVGGMMGTGAHGSSLWGLGSQVHDHVLQLRIVSPASADEGYVKVRTLRSGDPEMDAAKVSLGVLGVISQVTFKLQPLFKRSITYETRNDSDLGSQAVNFGRQHEFADFTWYPSQRKVVYRFDDRVPTNTSGNALLDFTGFRSTSTIIVSSLRTTEELQETLNEADGKCLNGKLTTETLKLTGYGLTNINGLLFTGYPVVGFQNRVQSSGTCLDSPKDSELTVCPWDHRVKGLFFHQTAFSVPLSQVKDFIEDVQKLVALQPKSLCVVDLYNGILMRYVTASSAYLGKQEDSLDFDITYYRSTDPSTPRLFEDVLEEIEQMAVFKYGALPHWGKNRNVAFRGVIKKFNNSDKFMSVKQSYDPSGLFSSDWTDQVLGLKDGLEIVKDGCALEGLCICSQDSHCAPSKGYYCRPGKVYAQARVCAKANGSKRSSRALSGTFYLFLVISLNWLV